MNNPRPELALERLRELMWAQPSTMPEGLTVARLVNNPSAMASTARLRRFRDQVRACTVEDPEDPDWPKFLEAVEAVLAWRETITPHERFWQAD